MSVWTTTIGAPNTFDNSTQTYWVIRTNRARVNNGLTANQSRYFAELRFRNYNSSQPIWISFDEGASSFDSSRRDLITDWEIFDPAIVISAGSLSIQLPGPNAPTNSNRDSNDPYRYSPSASKRTELEAFILAYHNLSNVEKAGTTLTLQDESSGSNPPALSDIVDQVTFINESYSFDLPNATGDIPITYAVTGLGSSFLYNADDHRIEGTPTEFGTHNVTVTATDTDGQETSVTFEIEIPNRVPTIADVTNQAVIISNELIVNLPYATGGDGDLSYTVTGLGNGLSYNSTLHRIEGTANELGTLNVRLTVTDADGSSDSTAFVIRIRETDTTPVLSFTVGVQNLIRGQEVNIALPVAVGGNAPISYMITGLPTGVAYDADGFNLHGSAQESGEFTARFTVTDVDSDSSFIDIQFNVADLIPDFGSNSIPNYEYLQGAQVNILLPYATGGDLPVSYSVSNLPVGIEYDDVAHAIVGIGTVIQERVVVFIVSDSDGDLDTIIFNFSIVAPPDTVPEFPIATKPSVAPIELRKDIAITPTVYPQAINGNLPLIYSFTNLPSGVEFNIMTRVLSGTPTKIQTIVSQYMVVDSDGDFDVTTYTFQVIGRDYNKLIFRQQGTQVLISDWGSQIVSNLDSGQVNLSEPIVNADIAFNSGEFYRPALKLRLTISKVPNADFQALVNAIDNSLININYFDKEYPYLLYVSGIRKCVVDQYGYVSGRLEFIQVGFEWEIP